jgi:hypothetical protein
MAFDDQVDDAALLVSPPVVSIDKKSKSVFTYQSVPS